MNSRLWEKFNEIYTKKTHEKTFDISKDFHAKIFFKDYWNTFQNLSGIFHVKTQLIFTNIESNHVKT